MDRILSVHKSSISINTSKTNTRAHTQNKAKHVFIRWLKTDKRNLRGQREKHILHTKGHKLKVMTDFSSGIRKPRATEYYLQSPEIESKARDLSTSVLLFISLKMKV